MQHYVIERWLKIWEFSGFMYKTYRKWLFVLKIHFEMHLMFIYLHIEHDFKMNKHKGMHKRIIHLIKEKKRRNATNHKLIKLDPK